MSREFKFRVYDKERKEFIHIGNVFNLDKVLELYAGIIDLEYGAIELRNNKKYLCELYRLYILASLVLDYYRDIHLNLLVHSYIYQKVLIKFLFYSPYFTSSYNNVVVNY